MKWLLLHGLLVHHMGRGSEVVQRIGLQVMHWVMAGSRLVVQAGGQDRVPQSNVWQEQRMGMMNRLLLMLLLQVMVVRMRLVHRLLVLWLMAESRDMVMQMMCSLWLVT